MYKVKTSLSIKSDKVSYGSSFPISEAGILATNYHVISKVLEKDKKYVTVVEIDGKKFPADIIAIDVIHDLALLKINKKFKKVVQLSENPLNKGEVIYSLGYPKELGLTITEGLFNGLQKEVVYEHYHVSSSLNSGMSGGPTVASNGKVVGVNVSYLRDSNNISFIVPIKFVKSLFSQINKTSLTENEKIVDQIIHDQLENLQNKFYSDFEQNSFTSKIGPFKILKPSRNIECWDHDIKNKDKEFKELYRACSIRSSAAINHMIDSIGWYEVAYNYFESDKLFQPAFYSLLHSEFRRYSSRYEKKLDKDNFSQYSCDYKFVQNDHDIPFKVSLCMYGYQRYKGLRTMHVKASSLLKDNKALILSVIFSGFEKKNYKKMIIRLLNGIKLKND